MDAPPSYEESASSSDKAKQPRDEKPRTLFISIREQVGLSQAEHVATIVDQLLPQIQARARRGLSTSRFALILSDQGSHRGGELVGFPDMEIPIVVELEGSGASLEFWSQADAISSLKKQILAAVSDGLPTPEPVREPLPERPPPQSKSWWSRRKSNRGPETQTLSQPSQERQVELPVVVDVEVDDIHFRTENEYGLLGSHRTKAVLLTIMLR